MQQRETMDDREFLLRLNNQLNEWNENGGHSKFHIERVLWSSPNQKRKRASVSVVLRPVGHSGTVTSVAELLENEGFKQNGSLQLLFIVRPVRNSDVYSGHTAFPGGKQEEGETLREAAERETFEEVGLQLSDENLYQYMGRLPDHLSIGGLMIVAPFVYLQLDTACTMKLNPDEVRAVRWAPLSLFISNTLPIQSKQLSEEMNLASLLGRHPKHFTSIIKCSLEYPNILLPYQGDLSNDHETLEFALWGLTLRIVMSLCLSTMDKTQILFPYPARSTNRLIDWICTTDIWEILCVYSNQSEGFIVYIICAILRFFSGVVFLLRSKL